MTCDNTILLCEAPSSARSSVSPSTLVRKRPLSRQIAVALAGVVALMTLPALTSEARADTPQASLANIGCLYAKDCYTLAFGVSDNGAVTGNSVYSVVTSANGGTALVEAFRWTPSGMVGLGFLDSNTDNVRNSLGFGVSADGSVIVGVSESFLPNGSNGTGEAFVWTVA